MVVYLDIMASNGLRVKVYMVDRGQYNNVVVYLDIMASIGLRARVYMVDSGYYNVEVHREFCVYYSLVRGTSTGFILGMYQKLNEGVYSRGLGSDSSREVDSKVDRVIYYVDWVKKYLYYNLVRGAMVEATLLWASVERDMLDKKVMMKFFSWWSVAHCARSKSASVGFGCNNFCRL